MDELKEKGNAELKLNNFVKAYNYYTDAIESLKLSDYSDNSTKLSSLIKSNDCLYKCYNNRSQFSLKLKNFSSALDDANRGLQFLK